MLISSSVAPDSSRQGQSSTYHSPLRARQAAETRETVLGAATRLFTARGWAGTTLAAVAAEAGTAVETVYSAFGSKSGLLIAAIDVAIVGDDGEEPLVERPEFVGLGVGERSARLARAARIITRALEGAVPLMGALREASASDAAASTRLHDYETDRRAVIAAGLQLIRGDKAPDPLVDSMWALASPEVFTKLTRERRWSVAHYERWLVDTAAALLDGADR
jgi:TetR/AcrR family transcriptional regulator of autoinduction and epiphytic fitness